MRLQRQQGLQLQAAGAETHDLQSRSNSLLAEKDAEIAALKSTMGVMVEDLQHLERRHRRETEVRPISRPKPCRSCLWL